MLLISDGVTPSNIDQGYVLRRIIRRLIRHMRKSEIDVEMLESLIVQYMEVLSEMYPELTKRKIMILEVLLAEKKKFMRTLLNGEKEFNKAVDRAKSESKTMLEGEIVFRLYETYGFPPEMTEELAKERELGVHMNEFETLYKLHQEKSRARSKSKVPRRSCRAK